jgi:hypothetical protein
MLPYELGTPAAFDFVGFNGRALTDDAMDVILTLATNTCLGDGVERSELRVPSAPSTASSHDRAAGSRIGRSLTDAGGELL